MAEINASHSAPDHAVRFDLQGNPVEVFPRAYCPGQVTLTLGGRKISAEKFANIVGLRQTTAI